MSGTTNALRRALLAVAGLTLGSAGSLVAGNYLMSGWSTSKVKTGFRLLPETAGPTNRIFVVFHGLWEGPDRLPELIASLNRRGNVLLASSGGNDLATPTATLNHLRSEGLLTGRRLYVVGYSKGSLIATLFARACREAGISISGMAVICGPSHQRDVLWPKSYLPLVVTILEPGPVVNWFWRAYWQRRYHHAVKDFGAGSPSAIRSLWCGKLHAGAVISGARLLRHGVDLKPSEFDFPALIIMHDPDPMVAECSRGWLEAMPNGHIVIIPVAGHGVYDRAREYYENGFNQLLAA